MAASMVASVVAGKYGCMYGCKYGLPVSMAACMHVWLPGPGGTKHAATGRPRKKPWGVPRKKKNEGEFRSGGANFVFRRKAPPLIFLDRPDARAAASAAWASADILAAHGSMADSTIHISEAIVGPRSGSLRR